MLNISEMIIRKLEAHGVKHIFCLVGGGGIFLFDALQRSPSIEPVCLLHEQSCAIAADAYAQANNKLGVLMVTTGPGVTNTLTGVAASYIDSTPLLIISGQVNTFHKKSKDLRQLGIQEVDTEALVTPIVKKFQYFDNREYTNRYMSSKIDYLIKIAQTPRKGPVWLDIPLNVQKQQLQN